MIGYSVVIPSFQRPERLLTLLRSIARQTHMPREVIVVDDCSDDTRAYQEVVQLGRELIPELIYLRNASNLGACASRNRGILEASQEWVAFVDDDDRWFTDKLESQAEILETAGDSVVLCYGWATVVDDSGKTLREMRPSEEGGIYSALLGECFVPSPTVVCRRQTLIAAGMFDTRLKSHQDWDCWLRVLANGGQAVVLKKSCAEYVKHMDASIGGSREADLGKRLFYRKYALQFLLHLKFRNLLRAIRLLLLRG